MNYRQEVYRKLIHISSAALPIAYLAFLDRQTMLWIIGVGTVTILVGETLRLSVAFFRRLFKTVFGKLIREEENVRLTGASFSFLGAFLTVLFFEEKVAVFALLVVALSDSVAALIGLKWGHTPLLGKSVQGTTAFLVVAVLIAFLVPDLPRVSALCAAVIATAVELFPSPINDNLMIPLAAGISLSIMNLIT